MKILLVSDKEDPYIWDHFDAERFKDIELIISCGDLKSEYLSFLVTMINAPLYYVPGNHNSSYIQHPPEGCFSVDDQLVKYKDISIIGFGGSHKYNKGPFQYTEQQMKKRIQKLKRKIWWNRGFDILVAHAPAFKLGDGEDHCHQGFEGFIDLIEKYNPKYFFHGHQHLNYGRQSRIIKYRNTTIINAYKYYILEY